MKTLKDRDDIDGILEAIQGTVDTATLERIMWALDLAAGLKREKDNGAAGVSFSNMVVLPDGPVNLSHLIDYAATTPGDIATADTTPLADVG